MSGSAVDEPFSVKLERWLESDEPKTLGRLGDVFQENAFAVAVLLLMITPALPLPTGGITHVFEAVTVLLGAQMVLGAKAIWLPARWKDRELGRTAKKALPMMMRRIRSLERLSRRRGAHLFEHRWFIRLLGLLVITFSVGSALAPPFLRSRHVPRDRGRGRRPRDHPGGRRRARRRCCHRDRGG